jgi:hypothetical protein
MEAGVSGYILNTSLEGETGLSNRAQPMERYQIGEVFDVGLWLVGSTGDMRWAHAPMNDIPRVTDSKGPMLAMSP